MILCCQVRFQIDTNHFINNATRHDRSLKIVRSVTLRQANITLLVPTGPQTAPVTNIERSPVRLFDRLSHEQLCAGTRYWQHITISGYKSYERMYNNCFEQGEGTHRSVECMYHPQSLVP